MKRCGFTKNWKTYHFTFSGIFFSALIVLFCVQGKGYGDAYRIQVGDAIQVSVLGLEDEEKVREVTVREDGKIFLPMAGLVDAKELTYDELAEHIKEKLSKYFKNFDVLVGPADAKPQFSVLGKVGAPGAYPLTPGLTLSEAVGIAGGLAPGASPKLKIIRFNKDVLTADMDKILNDNDLTQNILIRPGDVVYASDKLSNKVMILGSVKTPGEYDLQPGWSIAEAIVFAGGLVTSAGVTGGIGNIVYIQRQGFYSISIRRGGKDLEQFIIDPLTLETRDEKKEKFPLQHGDVIFVREVRFSVIVIGAVKNPYIYEFKQGDRVTDAIAIAGGLVEGVTTGGGSGVADLKNVGIVRVVDDKSKLIKVNLEDVLRKGDFSTNYLLADRDILYVPSKHRKLKWDEIIAKLGDIKFIRDLIKFW